MSKVKDDQRNPSDKADKRTGQTYTPADHDKPGCCGSCGTAYRREFHVRNFGFSFNRPEAFQSSQWRWPAFVFVCYRLSLAIYSVSILVWTITKSWKEEFPWPTYMTNWAYTVLTLHLVYSAIVAVTHAVRQSKKKITGEAHPYGALTDAEDPIGKITTASNAELPFYLKLEWLLFVVASALAPMVTSVYWIFIAPEKGVPFLQDDSINEHLINTVIVVLELSISAIPVRLLHFVYITLFGFIYAVFTVIYWAVDHNNILYKSFSNWNQPTNSIIRLAILMFVVSPLVQFGLFSIYQLRLLLYRRIYHESYIRRPIQQ